MIAKTALLARDLDDIIAISRGQRISCRTFLGQVQALAESLPDTPVAINLCEDRYAFMLGFFAAIVRGQCNLLLPSHQPGVVREAMQKSTDRYVLHDGRFSEIDGLDFDLRPTVTMQCFSSDIPMIDDSQLAAVVHTSGSTGDTTQIPKYWRTLRVGAELNRAYLLKDPEKRAGLVATVPPGHMYGLETSILLPLFSNTQVYSGNSLFPGDIRAALEQMPGERILVSTPMHLRAIVRSQLPFLSVSRVVSATAPLTQDAAQAVEQLFSAEVLEIYGCSEAGCLAYRWVAKQPEWEFFHAFRVTRDGPRVCIGADHLPEAVELADLLEFVEDGRFILKGRETDLVKIGGKRGSLAELTNRLLAIDGVQDAIVFQLSTAGENSEFRLSALVVAPNRTPKEIRMGLAEVIDPVFLPRPIRCVDALPRSSTGKLRKAELEKIVSDLSSMA
jgi:acyl-coenzyme A synthetase/AMP-(fatty) acid ligase